MFFVLFGFFVRKFVSFLFMVDLIVDFIFEEISLFLVWFENLGFGIFIEIIVVKFLCVLLFEVVVCVFFEKFFLFM